MNSTKIGCFIAECRKEKQITQQELADMLNITNKAVSKWETGNGLPDIALLTQLATVLGISVDEILRGEKKAASAVVEGASANADTEKQINSSADLMLNYLVHKAIDKFQMMAIVSIIISFIALIVQFSIWSETKNLTGWFFGCWLDICSTGVFYYYERLMKNQIRDYNASAERKINAKEIRQKYLIGLFILWGIMLLTLPFYLI